MFFYFFYSVTSGLHFVVKPSISIHEGITSCRLGKWCSRVVEILSYCEVVCLNHGNNCAIMSFSCLLWPSGVAELVSVFLLYFGFWWPTCTDISLGQIMMKTIEDLKTTSDIYFIIFKRVNSTRIYTTSVVIEKKPISNGDNGHILFKSHMHTWLLLIKLHSNSFIHAKHLRVCTLEDHELWILFASCTQSFYSAFLTDY